MAQFVAYRSDIDGNIDLLLPYFNADSRGQEKRLEVFKKHGIDLHSKVTYPMQTLLNYLKDVCDILGDRNTFLVGRASAFSLNIDNPKNFKTITEELDIIYHTMYTIKGKPLYDPQTKTFEPGLGHYEVVSFDERKQEMIVKSSTPFTDTFDEAVLAGLFEKYKPKHISTVNIIVDINKERRGIGADSSTFIVTWK